jgi:hypothetical protein
MRPTAKDTRDRAKPHVSMFFKPFDGYVFAEPRLLLVYLASLLAAVLCRHDRP